MKGREESPIPEQEHRRLAKATARAAERSRRELQQLAETASEPPRVGDVYLLPATAEWCVEWVVVDHDADSGLFLVALADISTLAGSHDVCVPSEDHSLTLRSRFCTWLPADLLRGGDRSGRVTETDARTIRELRLDFRPRATLRQQEVDRSPEYSEWIREVVAPAHRRLGQSAAGHEPITARRNPWWRWQSLAAALLLLAGGFLGGRLIQPTEEPNFGEANLPVAWLYSAASRGTEAEIELGPNTERYLLFFPADPPKKESYRLEIFDDRTDQLVYTHEELMASDSSDGINIALDRRLLSPGKYRVLLYGIDTQSSQLLSENLLVVEESD